MVKMSTKGRYGTRLMVYLAQNHGNGNTLLKDIAAHENLSEGYLEQIVPSLKSAGLIRGIRGAHGGYVLTRSPAEINMQEIFQVLEGDLKLCECVNDQAACDRQAICATRDLWKELSDQMNETLAGITLHEMAERTKKKIEEFQMYSI